MMLGTLENQMRFFIHLPDEGYQVNWKDTKSVNESSNHYERKVLEALLGRKLPNFNPTAEELGLGDLTSPLVSRVFPRIYDLDLPPGT